MIAEFFEGCLQIEPSKQTPEAIFKPIPLPACKGILLFSDKNDRPIQFLIAANIRRTAIAKLFPLDPETVKKRANIAAITRKVYFLCCYNDFKSRLKYHRIARAIYPDSYKKILTFPRQSYVHIDTSAQWPFFSLKDNPSSRKPEKVFGPFPTRRSAREFIQVLQNAFGLCQRPSLLVESCLKAESCPYLQMNICPAPCAGKISRSEYLEYLKDAIHAAEGNIQEQRSTLLKKMRSLAEHRNFEQAQAVKIRLEELEKLTKESYRWTSELSRLCVLHIDRSAKIKIKGKRKKEQTFSAFLIKAGAIYELQEFSLENMNGFYRSFTNQLNLPLDRIDRDELTEQLTLLNYGLYRSKPSGLWLDCRCPADLPNIENIEKDILSRFMIKS